MTRMNRWLAAMVLITASTLGLAQTPTLQIQYANAGTTASLVADCVAGSYQGADTRGCSGATDAVPANANTTLYGEGHALFQGHGLDTQAWARASFGDLGAYAQTVATNPDAFYNVQSRGASELTDYIVASNTSGAALTTYQFTVTVHGSLSAPVGCVGTFPCATGNVFVGFNTSATSYCAACQGVVDNWTSESGQPSDTVYTGTFTMVTGTTFMMRNSIDVSSYINVFANQSVSALADYGNTVTLQLTGVTPGANTVGLSGHDYATTVPEPASALLTAIGLACMGAVRLLRQRR